MWDLKGQEPMGTLKREGRWRTQQAREAQNENLQLYGCHLQNYRPCSQPAYTLPGWYPDKNITLRHLAPFKSSCSPSGKRRHAPAIFGLVKKYDYKTRLVQLTFSQNFRRCSSDFGEDDLLSEVGTYYRVTKTVTPVREVGGAQ